MFKPCSQNRGALYTVAGLLLLSFAGTAADSLQADMNAVLKGDPRNDGVNVHVERAAANVLIYDLISVAPTNSAADVFRVLLQFAQAEKARQFKALQLNFRGAPRFLIPGDYFRELGEEFGAQNPVYTIRTFPEHLTNIDGSRAYATWSGGLIGVVGKQIEDSNDFHRRWWMDELLNSAGSRTTGTSAKVDPPSDAPVPTSAQSLDNSQPGGDRARNVTTKPSVQPGVSESPSGPLQIPDWLTVPSDQRKSSAAAANHVHCSYDANEHFMSVVSRYETELRKAGSDGVRYDENGNGHTVNFRATSGEHRLFFGGSREYEGAHVEVDCVHGSVARTSRSATPAIPRQLVPIGVHRVEYRVDGSAIVVGLTYRNPTGGTEQRDVSLPGSLSFNAVPGFFVYFSAQNKGDSGEVHVAISIDGRLLQEASSSTAYGIATASGSVPR